MTKPLALLAAGLLLLAACGAPKPPATVSDLALAAASGDAGAIEGLIGHLGSEVSPDERGRAYKALLDAGRAASKAVMAATGDADPARREHALALAANLKLDGAYEAAVKALLDPSFERAHVAAWALGELGNPAGIEPLADAMTRFGPGLTAREAARALEKFGPRAVPALLARMGSMRREVRGYVVRILGEIRDPRGKPAITAALADPELRVDAVWALGTLGLVGASFDSTPYLSDSDHRVRVEACRTTGLLGIKSAMTKLDVMRAKDEVVVVREWAARGKSLLTGVPEKYLTKDGKWKVPDNIYH